MKYSALGVFVLLAIALLAGPGAMAQTAQLTGRVTDSTDAVIPGTSIRVINEATAAVREVTTNEVGYYTVSLLPPGNYRIEVEAVGFRPYVQSGITLAVDQRAEINLGRPQE